MWDLPETPVEGFSVHCCVSPDNQYGCIAVWEADYPQVMKTLKDLAAKRQQLLER